MTPEEHFKNNCANRKEWRIARDKRRAISESTRKERSRESSKKSYQKNKEKIRKRVEKYYSDNREMILERNSIYCKELRKNDNKYRKKRNATSRVHNKTMMENLTDGYVINLLKNGTSLKKEDIPQELIKLKRIEIQLKRGLKYVKDNK